ncbi:hypothetical protein NHH03_10055 [Stieleria sp. TO1_6]|uniref:hypothetical protein n=1 Tax=Stieleria tagensis TaxID=2956795 RepID=UPI00209A7055|nr:hypothetical protein [Stieleria tagensis]MCO8122081.1 hypothetical protein [Stieleria tagensis]
MKVISLTCNHCGAPLEVPAKARFVTCGFCEARLAIEHTGNSYTTSVLEELQETTAKLAQDVAQIKQSSEIDRLDSQWLQTRSQHMVTNKNGHQSLPTKGGAIIGGVVITLFGLFWTVMALGITSAGAGMGAPGVIRLFPLFGLLFVGFGIFMSFRMHHKADAYQKDLQQYRRKRQDLVDDITQN